MHEELSSLLDRMDIVKSLKEDDSYSPEIKLSIKRNIGEAIILLKSNSKFEMGRLNVIFDTMLNSTITHILEDNTTSLDMNVTLLDTLVNYKEKVISSKEFKATLKEHEMTTLLRIHNELDDYTKAYDVLCKIEEELKSI